MAHPRLFDFGPDCHGGAGQLFHPLRTERLARLFIDAGYRNADLHLRRCRHSGGRGHDRQRARSGGCPRVVAGRTCHQRHDHAGHRPLVGQADLGHTPCGRHGVCPRARRFA